jgi:hypothetical protein
VLAHRSDDGSTEISHLNGVPWHEAPLPRRWHFCEPQTQGWRSFFTLVERCACGAKRFDGRGRWKDRNSRRRESR